MSRRPPLWLAAGLALAALAPLRGETKVFAQPGRVRYDGQCLTLEGRDVLIWSGTFQYFRCPKPLWRERFQKIKAAGCNAVETYVPWNWHERAAPASVDDFSQVDLSDLRDWLRMAHDEFGLYTIIRPGPYICAEWDQGGFPRWLFTKKPAGAAGRPWLRSDDPVFLAWSVHWLKAVCPVVAAEQVTRKAPGHGGVILFQIENEYDFAPDIPAAERAPHLRALYQSVVAGGIDVPIFTCWTAQCRDSADPELSQVFDAFNAYPRFQIDTTAKSLAKIQADQPDAPAMISELQGGWFGQVGGKLSEDQPGLTPEEFTAHTLLAIQDGATLLNTYVLFGGTNFGGWGGRGQTTSYDYDAPIREDGGVGAKYAAFAAIGRMLQRYGPELARSHPVNCQAETGEPEVTVAARRGRGGAAYLFFRNHSVAKAHRGTAIVWLENTGEASIEYDLGPFGFKVLRLPPKVAEAKQGEWLPQAVREPARPARLPDPVRPAAAESRPDPGATDEVPAPAGALLPALGVYDARPVEYRADFALARAEVPPAAELKLARYRDDGAVVEINGRIVASGSVDLVSGDWLRAGPNTIRILYDQRGGFNVGRGIEDQEGLRSVRLARSPAVGAGAPWALEWKLGRQLGGVAANWAALPDGAQSGWTPLPLDAARPLSRKGSRADAPTGASAALATWYRVEFALPVAAPGTWVPWHARIDAAGNGSLYLNGENLGRYWETGPQREFYLPECWLKFGPGPKNVLTLCLSPDQRGVALRAVEIDPAADTAEQR
jgi:hypothetical protein